MWPVQTQSYVQDFACFMFFVPVCLMGVNFSFQESIFSLIHNEMSEMCANKARSRKNSNFYVTFVTCFWSKVAPLSCKCNVCVHKKRILLFCVDRLFVYCRLKGSPSTKRKKDLEIRNEDR